MSLLCRTLLGLLLVAQILSLAIAFQRPAYAYADPGSGLLFMQIAGSMVAGSLFMIRTKLRKLFRPRAAQAEETVTVDAQESQS